MYKLIASILLVAFISQTFNQGLYYFDYLVQKSEYAKHCVNKARPKMHCNGKCQMMKKMAEEEKKEAERSCEMKLASQLEAVTQQSSLSFSFNFFIPQQKTQFFINNSGAPVSQPSSVFHPPPAFC